MREVAPRGGEPYAQRRIGKAITVPLLVLLTLWLWLLIAVGAFRQGPNGDGFGTDFAMFYAAARQSADGKNPYDEGALYKREAAIMHHERLPMTEPQYVRVGNPPLLYWALGPLTRLPFQVAAYIWIASLGVLAASTFIALALSMRWQSVAAPLAVFLVTPPTLFGFYYANIDAAVFVALAVSYKFCRSRPFLAGAVASLSLVKPQVAAAPMVLIVLFYVNRKVPFVAGFLIAVGSLSALTIVAIGAWSFHAWLSALAAFSSHGATYTDIGSLAGFYAPLVNRTTDLVISGLLIVFAGAVTYREWIARRNKLSASLLRTGWLWALWLLCSPFIHLHDEVILAIPVVALMSFGTGIIATRYLVMTLYLPIISILFVVRHPFGLQLLWVPLLGMLLCLWVADWQHGAGSGQATAGGGTQARRDPATIESGAQPLPATPPGAARLS